MSQAHQQALQLTFFAHDLNNNKKGGLLETVKGRKAVFEKYQDALFRATLCIEGNPRGEEIEEEVFIRCPKIPKVLFMQVIAFLAWCHKEHYSEGMLYFVYRQDPFDETKGSWDIYCPLQYVTGASVCAHAEKEPEESAGAVGDIHSHPAMGWSGHSSIDDHDERGHNHGIYMVASWRHGIDPTLETVELTIYGYVRGRRVVIRKEHIINFDSAAGEAGFPAAWKAKVHHGDCKICRPAGEAKNHETRPIHGHWERHGQFKEDGYLKERYRSEGYPGIDWS